MSSWGLLILTVGQAPPALMVVVAFLGLIAVGLLWVEE